MNCDWTQELMKDRQFTDSAGTKINLSVLIKTKFEATRNCRHDKLKCAGCLLAICKKYSNDTSVTKIIAEISLKVNKLFPGELVHCDQYESSVHGRRTESFGKEKEFGCEAMHQSKVSVFLLWKYSLAFKLSILN